MKYNVELTDTFSGEANYSWAKRATIEIRDDASKLAIMRAAKRAMGLNGVRGKTSGYGDYFEFRPTGSCTILFATYTEETA